MNLISKFKRYVCQLQKSESSVLQKVLNLVYQVSAAFSTILHQNTDLDDSPVVFGTVNLNIGDGYDEFTGLIFMHGCVLSHSSNFINVLYIDLDIIHMKLFY